MGSQPYYPTSPTSSPKDAQFAQDQPQPPATPTPSAIHPSIKYESPFSSFTVSTHHLLSDSYCSPSRTAISRYGETTSSQCCVRSPVHAQAALRRSVNVPIVPEPAPISAASAPPSPPPPQKRGFHVLRYEVKQERYYLHPSLRGQNSVPPPSKPNYPPAPSSEPPLPTPQNASSSSDESDGSSTEDDDSESDGSGHSASDDEDDSELEESGMSSEEVTVPVATPKKIAAAAGKRKRTSSSTGFFKIKEEAGSSFIDKNAHIKRPRNAWIHVRIRLQCTITPALALIHLCPNSLDATMVKL